MLASSLPAGAQIRASEFASVSQTIDGTRITVDYSRPRVRGRAPLFGERRASVVHWGEVWTPGANYATTFETNKPFTLDGHAIDKGKYSVRVIPSRDGAWTMVLDPDFRRFHMDPPDSLARQIRFTVHPATAALEAALTFSFTDLSVTGARLNLHWGTTRVSMAVAVTPSLRMQTPAAEAAPFLGTYDWYTFGLFEKEEIVDVETTWVAEFTRGADGRVASFVVRDDEGKIQARGTKRP